MNKTIFSFLAIAFVATGIYAYNPMYGVKADMTKSHEAHLRADYPEAILFADKAIAGTNCAMASHPEIRIQGQAIIKQIEELREETRELMDLADCEKLLTKQLSELTQGNVVPPTRG